MATVIPAKRTQGTHGAGAYQAEIANGRIIGMGSVSLDSGSIAATATAVATATVTGAKTTDQVIATAPRLEVAGPTLIEDLVIVSARISATDTVEIRLKNTHAADAKDAIAASFGIIVIRT